MRLNHSKPRRRNSKLVMIVLMLLLIAAAEFAGLVRAQEILFFSRSADIGEDRVWIVDEFSEGAFTLDLTVARWDGAAKRWTECDEKIDCKTNRGRLAWGMPVYSPVEGKVKTCWRGFPDNPKPNATDPGVGSTIFGAGNHLNIQTAQGNVVIIAHLKQGSIPEKLCPNRNGASASLTKSSGSAYPDAAVIPISSRPSVKRGEFIGHVGNSGSSSQPHVHINQQRAATDTTEDPPFAMKFVQGWTQSYSETKAASANWIALKRSPITSSDGNTMFHPSPFLRRGSIGGGPVFDVDMTYIPTTSLAVTAVTDESRNLKLISWLASGKGFTRKNEISAGHISEVKIARSGFQVVAGVRDDSNDLKLILYSVTNAGHFIRRADTEAGPIGRLSMTTIGATNPKIVTAVRDASGNLKLIVWNIPQSGNAIERLGQATAGVIADVAVAEAKNFPGVITAVRSPNGNLKVIPWRISPDGQTITRGADAEAGFVGSQISVVGIQQAAVVAARDGQGKLRVITFELSPKGDIVTRHDTEVAGDIMAVDIDTTPQSGSNVVTTVRDASGSLRLIAWSCDARGRNLRRGSASEAGDVGTYSAVGAKSFDTDILLTAMRDGQGKLKLIYWDANLSP